MPIYSDQLLHDESLGPDHYLTSQSGRYTLVYQGDGNLVLYKNYINQDRRALWASNTAGRPVGVCVMQGDGNLVIYQPDGRPIWASGTDGHPGSRLVVQDDGNVVIYQPDGRPIWATDTVQEVPSGPPAQGDDMEPGEVLYPDQFLTSNNGAFTFVYQGDGNLVLYKNYINRDRRALWASNTNGRPAAVCIMQGDGNLVIYDPDGKPIWASGTDGHPGSRLVVQDDGNVVIYQTDGRAIWATNTVEPIAPTGPTAQGDHMAPGEVLYPDQFITANNGGYTFVYQGDGNLVLYKNIINQDRRALWASNTARKPTGVCIMQGDGNLVIYDFDGRPLWATATNGHPGSRLVVQDDGNVVIYQPDDKPIWVTDTVPPIIKTFTPTGAQMGDKITIEGNNFNKIQKVTFNNTNASFSVTSRTMITATVPDKATSGPITITNHIGSGTSTNSFTVIPTPPPIINGFSPNQGKVGTGVTITGSNLSRVTSIKFNGVSANFKIESDTKITTTVPANATDGPITVSNRSGSATSSGSFDVQETRLPANLAFLNTWMEPSEFPAPNTPFTVKFSFMNGGQTDTGSFTIRIVLNNNADQIDISAPSYAPGATDFVYWNFPKGLPAGNHFFYAYLDVNNEVLETSEADNVSYHGFSVS